MPHLRKQKGTFRPGPSFSGDDQLRRDNRSDPCTTFCIWAPKIVMTAYRIRSVADAQIPAVRPRAAPDFVNEAPVDRRPHGQKLMPPQSQNGVMAQGSRSTWRPQ